jgi:pyoverdine/dityrosine biosynthesis protein Dit1
VAYSVILKNNAFSRLVAEKFPHAVRLSIHPQPRGSSKIGVRLLPSSDNWRTPWHSVALLDGEKFTLVKRKEADELGAVVHMCNGKYPFYKITEMMSLS